jgi:hypothetical protein
MRPAVLPSIAELSTYFVAAQTRAAAAKAAHALEALRAVYLRIAEGRDTDVLQLDADLAGARLQAVQCLQAEGLAREDPRMESHSTEPAATKGKRPRAEDASVEPAPGVIMVMADLGPQSAPSKKPAGAGTAPRQRGSKVCKVCQKVCEGPYSLVHHRTVHKYADKPEESLIRCTLCEYTKKSSAASAMRMKEHMEWHARAAAGPAAVAGPAVEVEVVSAPAAEPVPAVL